MSLNAVKILGIKITTSSEKEILEELEKRLKIGEKNRSNAITIVTPNPEQIVYAQGDKKFKEILNQAGVAIPDGIGVVWAHRLLGGKESFVRIPGVELMEKLVRIAAKRGVRIALMGGRGTLAVETLECLSRSLSGVKGVALSAPEFTIENGQLRSDRSDNLDEYFQGVSQKLVDQRVNMVFVALGAPKQEYVIERLRQSLVTSNQSSVTSKKDSDYGLRITDYPVILMSVGGSFDIITGRTPRAPQFMRTLSLEWLWRLLREPWRLGRQFALLKFVGLVVRERFASK